MSIFTAQSAGEHCVRCGALDGTHHRDFCARLEDEAANRRVAVDVDLARASITTGCKWTMIRKEAMLRILKDHPTQVEALKRRFLLSDEELASWRRGLTSEGLKGLAADAVYARRA